MSRRKSKGAGVKLTTEEIKTAAARMMAGAQAHQRAAAWCLDKPDAKPPNIDCFFFGAVAFELILLSVEQSLRLLLLLQYSIIRDSTDHNPHVFYKAVKNKSGGKGGIRQDIINEMNALGQSQSIDPVTEKELEVCLGKHDSSYSNFRYFQLDRSARLNTAWGFSQREVQILHCLTLALISLNMDEMKKRGISALLSMSRVPDSEMTEDLKVLKDRIASP